MQVFQVFNIIFSFHRWLLKQVTWKLRLSSDSGPKSGLEIGSRYVRSDLVEIIF